MSVLMMLAASGAGLPQMRTFTANALWSAPMGTTRLERLIGRGGDGTPDTTSYHSSYRYELIRFDWDSTTGTQTQTTLITEDHDGTAPSTSYCDQNTQPLPNGYYYYCYIYTDTSTTTGGEQTTGADTTAFGKIFPGGVGGPAASAQYDNVAVTPGQSYPITVPPGGSITITYFG